MPIDQCSSSRWRRAGCSGVLGFRAYSAQYLQLFVMPLYFLKPQAQLDYQFFKLKCLPGERRYQSRGIAAAAWQEEGSTALPDVLGRAIDSFRGAASAPAEDGLV
jgi:hypothetical protein